MCLRGTLKSLIFFLFFFRYSPNPCNICFSFELVCAAVCFFMKKFNPCSKLEYCRADAGPITATILYRCYVNVFESFCHTFVDYHLFVHL